MRIVLLSLLAVLASGPAFAECSCLCVGGASRGVCSQPAEIPPICQQLCPISLAPPMVQSPLNAQGGGGAGGGMGAAGGLGAAGLSGLGAAAGGANLNALAAGRLGR